MAARGRGEGGGSLLRYCGCWGARHPCFILHSRRTGTQHRPFEYIFFFFFLWVWVLCSRLMESAIAVNVDSDRLHDV